MTLIGETLRRERLKRRLDLEGVSRELKISPRMLEAIEDERFDRLPGGVFAKSFVRQYARMLGLDEEEIVGELERMLEPPPILEPQELAPKNAAETPPQIEAWETMGDTRTGRSSPLRSLVLVILVMALCSAVYAWWQRGGHFPWRLVLSHDDAPAAVEAVHTPVAPVAEATPQPQPPPETQPEAPKVDSAAADAPAADTTRETPEAPLASPAAVATNAETGVRVEITAQEQQRVWFSARADGKFLYAITLEPNESRTVEATKNVLLKLGNAGGANFSLNGKPVGPVGPKGQIRSVQFTSGGFQIVVPDASNPPASKDLLDDPF
jgi:cytoskeleton protein RodZ